MVWLVSLRVSAPVPANTVFVRPQNQSEVEGDLGRQVARSHVVRPAEGRQEVVERVLAGDIDRSQIETVWEVDALSQSDQRRSHAFMVSRSEARR
jgi:hypothetical protein